MLRSTGRLMPHGTSWQHWATARHTNNAQRTLSMKLNCGIVGLPNVGKSTLFNALVGSEAAQAANFPFCTIGTFVIYSFSHWVWSL